mgnify:CR=1 FL=1
MSTTKVAPGPDAHQAFREGMIVAAIAGFAGIAILYWAGLMTLPLLGFTLLLGIPIYLVFAAVALSVWLGFNKDATDLRPVYRERKQS